MDTVYLWWSHISASPDRADHASSIWIVLTWSCQRHTTFSTIPHMARSKDDSARVVKVSGAPIAQLSPQSQEVLDAEVAAGRVLRLPAEDGVALYVPYGEGWAVPLTFDYVGAEPLPWQIVIQIVNGQARCTSLSLVAPPGQYIAAEQTRVPLGRLVEEALLMVAIEIDAEGKPLSGPIGERVTSVAEARKLHERIEREHRRRARGKRVVGRLDDDARLREVGRVYCEGMATGRPTLAVEKHFKPVSRSTVSRWVRAAKEAGYIPPSPSKEGTGNA